MTLKRTAKYILIGFAAFVCVLCIVAKILNFGCHCATKADTIVNYLHQLDEAKTQWAIDHKDAPVTNLTWNDLSPYVETNSLNRSFAGETYLLNKIGEPVLAFVPKKTDWIPANTEVRFGPDEKVQIRAMTPGSVWAAP